jgi:hypothetical protein
MGQPTWLRRIASYVAVTLIVLAILLGSIF